MPDSKLNTSDIDFIPSAENRFFSKLFWFYVRFLFKMRFKNVWLQQHYQPSRSSRTVYFINHTSWWDGIIPLLLNESLFHQKARAMMEDKQLLSYPFFKYLGAFSVNKSDSRKAMHALRYALKSLDREHSCLFIYPQGKIVPDFDCNMDFEPGIGWLYRNTNKCDFVPVAISILTLRGDKPDLFITLGEKIKKITLSSNSEATEYLQESLTDLIDKLHRQANTKTPGNHFDKMF